MDFYLCIDCVLRLEEDDSKIKKSPRPPPLGNKQNAIKGSKVLIGLTHRLGKRFEVYNKKMAFLDKMWRKNAILGQGELGISFVMMFQHQKETLVIYVLDLTVQVAYLTMVLIIKLMEPLGIDINKPYEYISQRAVSGGLYIYLFMDFDGSYQLKAFVASSSNSNCSFTLKTTSNLQSNTFGYVTVSGCSSGSNCGIWSITAQTQFTFTPVPNSNAYWISTPDCGANQVLGFASDPAASEGSMVDVCLVAKATSGAAFERQTWVPHQYLQSEGYKGETGPKVEEKPAA